MNKLLLLLMASILISTKAFASETISGAIETDKGTSSSEVLTETFTSFRELNEQYRQLFLDDWQRLMRDQKFDEACARAEQDEEFYSGGYAKQGRLCINTALFREKRLEAIQRKGIPLRTVKTEESYQLKSSSLQELVDDHEKQIGALKSYLEERHASIQTLQEKEKSGPLLKEKYKEELLKAEQELVQSEGFLREDNESLARISTSLTTNQGKEKDLNLSVLTDKERLDLTQNTREALLALQKNVVEMKKHSENQLRWKKDTLKACQEKMTKAGEARLEEWETIELQSMIECIEAFRESTHQQIENLQKRISFIQTHPSLFAPQQRSLPAIIGDQEHAFAFLKRGDDIVVGVTDVFPQVPEWFPFQSKSINPEIKGTALSIFDKQRIKDHSAHVAGIIASDQRSSTQESVGVAPGVRLEFFDVNALLEELTLQPLPNGDSLTVRMTADRTAHFIDSLPLYRVSQPYLIEDQHWKGLSDAFDLDKVNPDIRSAIQSINQGQILQSQSRIYNFSVCFNSQSNMGYEFNIQLQLPLLATFKAITACNKLIIMAMGNDGIYISTSTQYRILKALLKAQSTKHSMISVMNLLKDGITIAPNSNQPGDDKDIWERTISAPGFDIESNVFSHEGEVKLEKMSGTSMAAPHVTGAGAVVLSNFPALTSAELASCLLQGATPILMNDDGVPYEVTDEDAGSIETSGKYQQVHIERGRKKYGMGRVNINGALERATKVK